MIDKCWVDNSNDDMNTILNFDKYQNTILNEMDAI